MVDIRVKEYKRKFDSQLRHVKAILMASKKFLPPQEWETLVVETKKCVHEKPEDFFGPDLPHTTIVRQAIEAVFNGFLADIHVRDVQKLKIYRKLQ